MLLLFDIDGTLLLKAANEHRDAMLEALRVVHGVTDPVRGPFKVAGRTDLEIARGILLNSGVSAERIDARADDVRIAACEAYVRLVPDDLSHTVPPGVRELLEALDAHDGAQLGLVTGNFEAIARMKLRSAGIGEFFAAAKGGFGSDHEDRSELPRIARRRVGDGNGGAWPRERTIVIGDTPRDIACARADGVRVVAIATGPHSAEELVAADAVTRDARELRSVLEDLLQTG